MNIYEEVFFKIANEIDVQSTTDNYELEFSKNFQQNNKKTRAIKHFLYKKFVRKMMAFLPAGYRRTDRE